MKRQRFRLGSVLKHYELQKQRAEQELHQASRVLREIDAEIDRCNAEIDALAALLRVDSGGSLSAAAWMACGRRSEHLGRCLENAGVRRARQFEIVAKCAEQRKRWAIAEEMLLTFQRKIENANHAEEAKTLQLQLQETILRRWLGDDGNETPVT